MDLLLKNRSVMNKVWMSIIASFVLGGFAVLFAFLVVHRQITVYFTKSFEAKAFSQLELYHFDKLGRVSEDFRHIFGIVVRLSRDSTVKKALLDKDFAAAQSILDRQRKINQHLDVWSVFDRTGKVILVSTDIPGIEKLVGTNLREREYFRKVMETKKPYVSPVLTGLFTKDLILNFSAPVMTEKGEIAYVLNGSSPLKLLKTKLGVKNVFSNYYNVLLDRDANILLEDGESSDTSIRNIKSKDRVAAGLVSSGGRKFENEINYKGEKTLAMGNAVWVNADSANRFYFISYYPQSQFDSQIAALKKEVNRIFFGIAVVALVVWISVWLMNFWLASRHLGTGDTDQSDET